MIFIDIKIKNQEDKGAVPCYNPIEVIRMEENKLPKRKLNRWEKHDYSENGRYFITICTEGRKPILSRVLSVGDGALDVPQRSDANRGNGRFVNRPYRASSIRFCRGAS